VSRTKGLGWLAAFALGLLMWAALVAIV